MGFYLFKKKYFHSNLLLQKSLSNKDKKILKCFCLSWNPHTQRSVSLAHLSLQTANMTFASFKVMVPFKGNFTICFPAFFRVPISFLENLEPSYGGNNHFLLYRSYCCDCISCFHTISMLYSPSSTNNNWRKKQQDEQQLPNIEHTLSKWRGKQGDGIADTWQLLLIGTVTVMYLTKNESLHQMILTVHSNYKGFLLSHRVHGLHKEDFIHWSGLWGSNLIHPKTLPVAADGGNTVM